MVADPSDPAIPELALWRKFGMGLVLFNDENSSVRSVHGDQLIPDPPKLANEFVAQWRICFRWVGEGRDVEIVDYHLILAKIRKNLS